jgi:hypothetical protein
MEAVYWVLTWACHRKCRHCYDDRFRPYVRDDLKRVVGEGQAAYRAVLANLPDRMRFRDREGQSRRSLLVMAGGELLIDGVREELFYPVLEAVQERWAPADRPYVSIQTTGDILTPRFIQEMIDRGVGTIAIASIDDHHLGFEGDKKFAFMARIRAMMAPFGATEVDLGGARDPRVKAKPAPAARPEGLSFVFFGAQPELWIGELWPRGRAFQNGLSNAGYGANFCARWSGGKNFLNHGEAGSEVAIEPDGAVYPCCLKTKAPLGNLTEERLVDVLESLKGHPAFEAINQGDPEAMGLAFGHSREAYRTLSHVVDPQGRPFANVCLGCDAFFESTLARVLADLRNERLAARKN